MSRLTALWDPVTLAFGRLNQREQNVVLAGGGVALLLVLVTAGAMMSSTLAQAEHRVTVKTDQLRQVLELQGDYKARQAEQAERMATLGRSNVRLVSLVEDAAQKAGVNIGQLQPEDSEPGEDGVIESRVALRAAGLSADRLQKFLNLLEESPGIVLVKRLKIEKPYRKDTADIELTVTTYKMKT